MKSEIINKKREPKFPGLYIFPHIEGPGTIVLFTENRVGTVVGNCSKIKPIGLHRTDWVDISEWVFLSSEDKVILSND